MSLQEGPVTRPDFDTHEVQRLLDLVCADPGAERSTQRSPLDLEPTVTVRHSTEADVEAAFARARVAQQAWERVPVRRRAQVMRRFHDLLLEEQSALCDAIQWENGKARTYAADEVMQTAQVCRYYANRAPLLLRAQRRAPALPVVTRAQELRHPKGVVALISPWNYPLTIGATDLIPALLAGNGVVWMPDLQTVLTALMALDLLHAAGLPKDLVQVVAGVGPVVGPMLVERGDFVMFTGSTGTGRQVATRAAARLVDASLELGGKNACIVLADADLTRAVDIAVRGAFANTGQLCIGTERIYVHASVERAFTDAFVEAVEALALGSVIGWGSDMGPLINAGQLARTEEHVRDAVAKGATLLTGGYPRPDLGPLVYAPTVLGAVTDDMTVCRTETFGPVCAIYTFQHHDELVARVNDSEYGLSAAIVSRDLARAQRLAARLRVGAVNINEPFGAAYGSVDAPMGGMGASGIGRRHGDQGLLKYTESQTIASQHLLPLAPGRFSDETWARLLTLVMRVQKWVRRR